MGPAAAPGGAGSSQSPDAGAPTATTIAFAGSETPKPDANGLGHLPLHTLKAAKQPKVAFEPHTVLVRLQPGASPADQARVAAAAKGKVVETLPTGYLKITTSGSPEAAVKALGRDTAVASASLDRARYLDATPNDTYYATDQKYLATVRMPLAWNQQKSATGAVIAIVDTGVDVGHPDLVGKVLAGYNAVSNNTNVTDTVGHGTMVAGIAAANTNNALGVAGVAWDGRILPVKVFTGDVAYDSDVAEGITWAADHGAKVINLSLGGPGDDPALHSAIQYAVNKGAIVVAAAGNTGDNSPHYPGYYPEVLAVAATDANANLTDFSTWGDNVDIAAPGWDVASTYSRQTSCGTSCLYATGAGTSFSAPIVSGVAALIKTKSPGLTPAGIADRITSTARDAGPRGIDPYYGHGILDAYRALDGAATTDFPQRSGGAFEPNDVPARAVPVTTSISATFAMEGDVDWYSYKVASTAMVAFTVTPARNNTNLPQNADPVLEVYDSSLRLLNAADAAAAGGAEKLNLALLAGTFYIKVRNFNGAADLRSYTLSVDSPTPVLYFPLFTLEYRDAGQSNASNVAIGDVTGDGLPDAVFTNAYYFDPANDFKLFVFPQQPDGTLGSGVRYNTRITGENPGIVVLDANGDGRQDLALPERVGVELFLQKPDGTLADGVLIPGTTNMGPGAVAADMDKDGDDDLVAWDGSGVVLLSQGPPGQFTIQTIAAGQPEELKVGDLNGDGQLDIVAGMADYTIRLLERGNDGAWTNTILAADNFLPGDIEVADATGDGRADLLETSGSGTPLLYIYAQQPDGSLGAAKSYPTASSRAVGIRVIDWDRDGLADIFILHDYDEASFYRQVAPGKLEPEVFSHLFAGYRPQTWALGDLNHDQYPDGLFASDGRGFYVGYNVNGSRQIGPQEWVKETSVADFAATSHKTLTDIRLTMQRALNPSSVTGQTVKLLDGLTGASVAVTVKYDAATKTITIYRAGSRLRGVSDTVPLTRPGYPYRVVIGGVKDAGGDTFGGYSFTFTG